MRILKSIRVFAAIILTLTTIALVPLNTVGAVEKLKYVSEVYIAYATTKFQATRVLEERGYIPVEGNLNDGGKTFTIMGYKTTDDIRDSITDLAVMNMRGDYSVSDYKKLLKAKKAEIAEFLGEFMTVIKEYRANLKAGKTKAVFIHDLLNSYTDDDTKMKMGDLLNSTTLQDKVGINESIEAKNPEKLPDLITIIMQGNTQVIKSIEILLSVATDTADNTWIDRFAASDYDSMLDKAEQDRPELNTDVKRQQYLENLYGNDAVTLGTDASTLRGRLNDYTASELHIDTATEDDIKKAFGDIENDVDAMMKFEDWVSIGTIYEGLKNYEGGNYKKGELLEFFLKEKDPQDSEIFIPMAAALSDGQRYGLPFANLEKLLEYAFTTEDGWKEYFEKNKESAENLVDVSIYQNVDRELYKDDGTVALTGSAQRAENVPDGTTGTERQQLDTFAQITAVSWVATFGSAMAALSMTIIKNNFIKGFTDTVRPNEFVDTLIDVVFEDDAYNEFVNLNKRMPGGIDRIMKADNARLAVTISEAFKCVTLVLSIISATMTVLDLLRDKSVEQLPIPKYLVNNYTDADGGSYAINYKAVNCNRVEYFGEEYKLQKGSCADIMADEGKQWLALYASKNSKAGKPLTPDFIVQSSNKAPAGYEGNIHLIGEKGAINIESGAFRNYNTFNTLWQNITGAYNKYIFIKQSNDVKTYDESAGNMTASSIGGGMVAMIGIGCLILGGALGAVIAVLVNKKKKKKETA